MAITFSVSTLLRVVDQAAGPLNRIAGKFDKLSRRVSAAGKKIAAAGRKMTGMGKDMFLRMTLPITGLGFAAMRTTASFQKSMNMVRGITNATGEQFQKLEQLAIQLGKTTVFSTRDAAEAMKFLARTGLDVGQIMGALPKVLQLAAAGQMDLATSADIVTNIMKGYRMEVDELEAANDVLAKAFTSANVDLQMLGESFKYAGPVLKGVGVDFKEATALIAALGDAGIQGSMAGTTMRGAVSKLAAPSKKMIGVFGKLGIKVFDSTGKMKSLIDIISQLQNSTITTGELMEIFGLRAGPGMVRFVMEGKESLERLKDGLDEVGVAARLEKTTMEGLPGAIAKLKAAGEALLISFTTKGGLADAFIKLSEKLVSLMDRFSQLSPVAKKWIMVALGIAAVAPLVLMGLGMITTGIGTLTAAASPWLVIILAIIAALGLIAYAAYKIYKNWSPIKKFFTDLWEGIINTISRAYDWIVAKIGAIMKIPGLSTALKILSYTTPIGLGARAVGAVAGGPKSQTEVIVRLKAEPGTEASLDKVKKSGADDKVNVISDAYVGSFAMGMGF